MREPSIITLPRLHLFRALDAAAAQVLPGQFINGGFELRESPRGSHVFRHPRLNVFGGGRAPWCRAANTAGFSGVKHSGFPFCFWVRDRGSGPQDARLTFLLASVKRYGVCCVYASGLLVSVFTKADPRRRRAIFLMPPLVLGQDHRALPSVTVAVPGSSYAVSMAFFSAWIRSASTGRLDAAALSYLCPYIFSWRSRELL